MITYVNVLCASVVSEVLAESNADLIVDIHLDGLILFEQISPSQLFHHYS